MGDVGLAGFAGLAGVRRRADRPGPAQLLALRARAGNAAALLQFAHVVRQLRLVEGGHGRMVSTGAAGVMPGI